jgi:hypothetical protein
MDFKGLNVHSSDSCMAFQIFCVVSDGSSPIIVQAPARIISESVLTCILPEVYSFSLGSNPFF